MTLQRTSLLLLVTAIAACDRLEVNPGRDFGVRVLTPSPIAAIGKITVPVRIAVTGCDGFDAAVRGRDGATHPVEFLKQGDETFVAAAPVEWLRGEDGTCLHDARTPLESDAQILVTCRDAGRIATADLRVSYGTATRADWVDVGVQQATTQFLFPSADPLVPYALAPWFLDSTAYLYPLGRVPFSMDVSASFVDPLARPRVAANDSGVFLSAGCPPQIICSPVEVSPSVPTVTSEALYGVAQGRSWWVVFLPAHVVDMAFVANDRLIVLSELYRDIVKSGYGSVPDSVTIEPTASVVTRVNPTEEDPADRYKVIGYFPGELAKTRFSRTPDGQLAFVSFVIPSSGPIQSVLHETNGQSVVSSPSPTGDLDIGDAGTSTTIGSVQLSPDASSLIVNGIDFGSADSWVALAANAYPGDGDRGGAAWLTGAVGLWKGASLWWDIPPDVDTGGAEVFDAESPHARIYGYDVHPLPGSSVSSVLYGAVAVGDKLVLTTNTGVRILGPDGALVGGSDPLPCGLAPTSVAIRAGPMTAAVGAGRYLYVFDLAE